MISQIFKLNTSQKGGGGSVRENSQKGGGMDSSRGKQSGKGSSSQQNKRNERSSLSIEPSVLTEVSDVVVSPRFS